MKKLFFAYLLLIVEIVGYKASGGYIDFVPKFIGYLLIVLACKEYQKHSSEFSGAIVPSIIMTGVSFVSFVAKLVLPISSYSVILIDRVVMTIGFMLVSYKLVYALKAVQLKYDNEDMQFNIQIISYGWIVYGASKLVSILFTSIHFDFAFIFQCLSIVAGIILLWVLFANIELYDFDIFNDKLVGICKAISRKKKLTLIILILFAVLVAAASLKYHSVKQNEGKYRPVYSDTFTLSYIDVSKSIDDISINNEDRNSILQLIDFDNHVWKYSRSSASDAYGYYVHFNADEGVIWIPLKKSDANGKVAIVCWDKGRDFYGVAYYDQTIKDKIVGILDGYIK